MLHTSLSRSSVLCTAVCRCQSRLAVRSTLHFPPRCPYLFHVPVCLSDSLLLDPFRLSSLPKGKENGVTSCTRSPLLASLVVFLGFLPLGFPLGCFSFWYTPFGSLIPLLISLSQCLERKSVFLELQTFLGLEGTSPPCSSSPPPAVRHVRCSLHVSGQPAELEQFRDVQRLCIC